MCNTIETALMAAWRERRISCTELRILDALNHAGPSALTYDELAAQTGISRRTLGRTMDTLATGGYVLVEPGRRGTPAMIRLDSARFMDTTIIETTNSASDFYETTSTVTSFLETTSIETDRIPMPQTSPSRAYTRERASSSSSYGYLDQDQKAEEDRAREAVDFSRPLADPMQEAGARRLVFELKLSWRQARETVSKHGADYTDIPGWLGWLRAAREHDPRAMAILVARVKAGEPVPDIPCQPRDRPGERTYRVEIGTPTETREEIKARCAADKAALWASMGMVPGEPLPPLRYVEGVGYVEDTRHATT